jgi:hypothetical protein
VLLQEVDGLYRPIGFCSRKLNPAERRYSATEREMLAIMFAYDAFLSIVFDRDIKFVTDHEPLATAHKLKKPYGRLNKWFQELSDVSYKIEWIKGEQNFLPDFLSRCDKKVEVKEIAVNVSELKSSIDWTYEQLKDPELKQLIMVIKNKATQKDWNKITNGGRWSKIRRDLYLFNNVLYYNNQIVCPSQLKQEIMVMHHDMPLAGHKAMESTLWSIRKHYFWLNMGCEVDEFCKSCNKCQCFNYSNFKNVAPLKPIIVQKPMQVVGTDFMGPLRKTKQGNQYIVLAICHFTKFLFGRATRTCDAETTAKFLFEDIVCKHGLCETILSDQGSNYESKLIKEFCTILGCNKIRTTTYMPAGNGISERANKTIKPNLAKLIDEDSNDWDYYLQMAISAYNTTIHQTIGMSPYEAMFGRQPVSIPEIVAKNASSLIEPG